MPLVVTERNETEQEITERKTAYQRLLKETPREIKFI